MANNDGRFFPFHASPLQLDNPYEVHDDEDASDQPIDYVAMRSPRILSRRQMQTRSLNPQAATFVPTSPPSSSKRKASSSAKAGKSTTPVAQSTSDGGRCCLDNPVIRGQELFKGLLPESGDRLRVRLLDPALSTSRQAIYSRSPRVESVLEEAEQAQRLRDTTGINGLSGSSSPESEADRPAESPTATGASHPTPDRPGGKHRDIFLPRITGAVISQHCVGSRQRVDGATSNVNVRYLPLGSTNSSAPPSTDSLLEILPFARRYLDRNLDIQMPENLKWPDDRIPMELFELIASHLARSDIKNMRLVNKEFEMKVSSTLFGTAIVPFNTELYDMVDEQTRSSAREPSATYKGKGKARDDGDSRLHWNNAADDREGKVYNGHGLRVFEGFGPHIRRFGMNFEVSEDQLAHPPEKRELDQVKSYHGEYPWPVQQYARFTNLVGLERTADETSRMVAALSKLSKVQELGLSIDNGLGRLSGADRSIRNIVFDRSPTIFGDGAESLQLEDARGFWAALMHSAASTSSCDDTNNANGHRSVTLREQRLFYCGIAGGLEAVSGLRDSIYRASQSWPAVNSSSLPSKTKLSNLEDSGLGVFFTTGTDFYDQAVPRPVNPASLRKEQQEWLLEVGWAQRAFLESYMLAVVDNAAVFSRITNLKIAKISSGLLSTLDRPQFWHALPHVSDVIIMVNPDWRTVQRDTAGYVETPSESPGKAVDHFYSLLQNQIARSPSIKRLRIGYTDGGENAQGIFGRNSNVLPAPLFPLVQRLIGTPVNPLLFKNLWAITLVNCWLTPPALQCFLRSHAEFALGTVTLDSVSLTADPSIPVFIAGANQGPPHQAGALLGGGAHVAQAAQQQAQAAMQQALQYMPQNAQNPGQKFQNWWQHHQQLLPQLQMNQAQWQNMFQQLTQQMNGWGGFGGMGGAAPPPTYQPHHTSPGHSGHWTTSLRSTCWPSLIDDLSPGPRFEDYREPPQPWEEPLPPRAASNLNKIVFKSCGYVKIVNNAPFDQSSLDHGLTQSRHLSPWFRARHAALLPQMMTSNDGMLARIHSYIPAREMNALRFAWGMTEGWEDAELALDAAYDGHLMGGTGRFSGVVEMGMGLQGAVGFDDSVDLEP